MALYLTVTTSALGEFQLQDPDPVEGRLQKRIAPSTMVVIPVTGAQLDHLKAQLDAAVEVGMVSSYSFDDTEKVPSDELLELKNRTAKVATLAVTGGAVPNLLTLGIRKGDIFVKHVAVGPVVTSYEVAAVHSATVFEATATVVAFDILAAGDKFYFTREGVVIAGTLRTVGVGGVTHVIATVSQSPYQRTGFGRFFVKASDGKPYFITGAGAELSLGMTGSDPLVFKGTIAAANQFPLIADVKTGWLYRTTADVIDNGGVTYTNTGQNFPANAEIAWNGTNWSELGTQFVPQKAVATPVVIPAGNSVNFVDTSTIGGAIAAALPAVTAKDVGAIVVIGDCTGDCVAHNITITPNGTDRIDNVNAPLVLNQDYVMVALECVEAGRWKTVYFARAATQELLDKAKLDTVTGSGQNVHESFQLAAASETLRGFRAQHAGVIRSVTAETGTAAAAAESMTFDVQIAGVTALTGLITIDNGVAIDTPVPGVVGAGAIAEFAAGELISVVRVYVPGGGPTPMRDTVCGIQVEYTL